LICQQFYVYIQVNKIMKTSALNYNLTQYFSYVLCSESLR